MLNLIDKFKVAILHLNRAWNHWHLLPKINVVANPSQRLANIESCLFMPEGWICLNQAWALLGILECNIAPHFLMYKSSCIPVSIIHSFLLYLGRTFITDFFSAVYYPAETRVEKVSSALAHWEYGEIRILAPSKICWVHGKSVELTESQRNCDRMSPWQNSDEKSLGNLSRFRRVLHHTSVLGPNRLFHLGLLWGDRLQKKIPLRKSSYVKCWGVWIAFFFAEAFRYD